MFDPYAFRSLAVENICHLRSEASREVERILAIVLASFAESEIPKYRVALAMVHNGRRQSGGESRDGENILETHAHGVAGHALRIGDQNFAHVVAKRSTKRNHLCARTTAVPGASARLMAHVEKARRNVGAGQPVYNFGVAQQDIKNVRGVLHANGRRVIRRVGVAHSQYRGEWRTPRPYKRGSGIGLEDEPHRPRTKQHATPTLVEWQRRVFPRTLR